MLIYNIGMWLMVIGLKILAIFDRKAQAGVDGRRDIFEKIRNAVAPDDKTIWIHCASLGEFEQGRPVIETIKTHHPGYKILLTFFSPSGYEIRKNYPGADHIFYLPLDTSDNARKFVDMVKPEIAIFVKYEFWLNYLSCLRESGCRTFIISAIFRRDSVFFKWYGGIFRQALKGFEKLFVQDNNSKELLASIGIDIDNVIVSGDTRFDRVAEVRKSAIPIPTVAAFTEGHKTVVAGSTWPPDDELLLELARRHPDTRFVIAPHETAEERVEKLISLCPENKAVRFTKVGTESIPSHIQIMVIDTIGILSSIYAYADVSYIGGGFGVGIHNTLEAAVYGLPVAFGPNYGKFKEACDLIEIGAATSVTNMEELDAWLSRLWTDPELLESTGRKAGEYVSSHTGATETILRNIFGK
jgi:3-deoxy-D-manno-octulosonic-acid transferase